MLLITGGSGFLGRGLLQSWDDDIVVYSRDEYKQDIARKKYPDARYVLGDITDRDNLTKVLRAYRVETVVHAAAIKYIPEAEFNVREALRVNVEGSRAVFDAAGAAGVENVIVISTDKACNPLNVYGITKLLMERLLGEYSKLYSHTRFTGTRYGNVIGSTGSVIPLFKEQAKALGKIRITDPEMTRYWISIQEAIDLIRLASSLDTGDIIIPQPAAMKLIDLAECVAGDAPIEIIGVRPGEKQHESLLHEVEGLRTVTAANGEYYILKPVGYKNNKACPVVLTSSNPSRWMSRQEMLEHINYAEGI